MEQGFFITGTDTNVGKTWTTVALMRYFKNQGKSVIGMKPVAAGCNIREGLLVNDDALLLQENASIRLDYKLINPYGFELPVSPHIAGKNNPVDLAQVTAIFDTIKDQAQVVVIEGAGGWYSPINATQDNCDLAVALSLPVLLVVAIKLGCINHAILTYKAILNEGLDCAGWIAVCVNDQELCIEDNIAFIKQYLAAPLLAVLPFQETPDFDALAEHY